MSGLVAKKNPKFAYNIVKEVLTIFVDWTIISDLRFKPAALLALGLVLRTL